MHVISVSTLKAFWEQYPDAEGPLRAWHSEIKKGGYQNPNEVIKDYPMADTVKNNRLCSIFVTINIGSWCYFGINTNGFTFVSLVHIRSTMPSKTSLTSKTMNIKPIRTEDDYRTALRLIDTLIDCEDDSHQADQLDVLSILVENYENEHYPIAPPDPIDAIKFRMEQTGMSEQEIGTYLGGERTARAILNREEPLTLTMIKALYRQLHIPAESLLAS